jgi:hypothetical protein
MGTFKAVVFNTTTDLLDVVTAFSPNLVYPLTIVPVATGNSLTPGQLVNLENVSGSIQAQLANAATSLAATGFVLSPFTAGQQATVFLEGTLTQIIPGATYSNIGQLVYLSDSTPGGIRLTPPGSGLQQIVGQIVNFDGTNSTVIFHPLQVSGSGISSVGLSMPADFSVAGSPITVGGTIVVTYTTQAANTGFFGPVSGVAATPAWRNVVAADFGTGVVANTFLAGPASGPNAAGSFRTITIADLFGGTGASSTTVLYGDGTWRSVAGVSFETNGVANSAQNILNVSGVAGQIIVTNTSGGNVTIGLYVGPAILSFTNNINTVEIGTSKATVTLNWTLNSTPITTQTLTATSGPSPGSISTALRTATLTGPYAPVSPGPITWTLQTSDGINSPSATTSAYFLNQIYWGTSPNTSLTTAQILALSGTPSGGQQFATTRNLAVAYNCSAGGVYPYFCYPTSFGALTSVTVGGLPFSAYTVTTQSFTNASGYVSNYYVVRFNGVQSGNPINVVWA